MTKYLLKIWFLTIIISYCLSYCWVYYSNPHGSMTGILYIFLILHYLYLAIGSTTIFLNLKKRIRNNFYVSLASFFLVPIVIVLLGMLIFKTTSTYIFLIPYFLILSISFFLFRNSKIINKTEQI